MIRRSKPLRRSSAPIARRARVRVRKAGRRANLERECKALWSAAVLRKGVGCWLYGHYFTCAGRIDPAHVFGRQAHPGVEFEPWNGLPTCRAHHDYYGNSVAWFDLVIDRWGSVLYAHRYALACQTRKVDLAVVKAELEAA